MHKIKIDKDGTTSIVPVDIEEQEIIQAERDIFNSPEEVKNRYNELINLKRKEEYKSVEEQLDEIYHNGIDSWKLRIKSIKDKHPKRK